MIPDLDIYRSAQVLMKGTRAFPVPREGPGLSYRSTCLIFFASGLSEGGGVFWRHRRLHTREQVFDGEYLEARELPERRVEHASTGSFRLHRGRGLRKSDEQAHG